MKLGMVLAGSSCSKPSGIEFKMGASFEFVLYSFRLINIIDININTGDHVHHHKVANMNPSPSEDRVNNESLEVGDLVSMASTWQENRTNHMVKDSASHYQAVSRWFAHPLRIGKSAQPLNSLSRLKSRHSGPRLGLINTESNRRDV